LPHRVPRRTASTPGTRLFPSSAVAFERSGVAPPEAGSPTAKVRGFAALAS
jgi:hypothetical protein